MVIFFIYLEKRFFKSFCRCGATICEWRQEQYRGGRICDPVEARYIRAVVARHISALAQDTA